MVLYARSGNSTSWGNGFDPSTVEAVWRKATPVEGNDPNVYRRDGCNAWIRRSEYGQITNYGWEIDHIKPVALGGSDSLSNLQPLHWKNNRRKGDNWPQWSCAVTNQS